MVDEGRSARAVVIGGSVAGLLAARVLADTYAEVLVLDRDDLPGEPKHRRGVPQSHHAHALLARGQEALEELFPGVTAALTARGAPTGDMLGDARLHFGGRRLRHARSGVALVSPSRILLEDEVRRRVRALPRVTFAPACSVVGLTADSDGHRVSGVDLVEHADSNASELREADLVLDATGRTSRAPVWLEALGYSRPLEEQIAIELRYTSQRYRIDPDALGGALASVHAATVDNPRGGVLARLEGDVWLLTLAGILGDRPPTDREGLLSFARSLRFPDIYDALQGAEPLGEARAFRFPAAVRRRYERLDRLPDGFLALGDSICSFNPVYAQGMTVAALQALVLRRHLSSAGGLQTRLVLREFARVADAPWEMARAADLAFPGVPGRRTSVQRLLGTYMIRLQAAAEHDASLATAFVRVMGLLDEPAALLAPRVLVRVFGPRMFRSPPRRRNDPPEGSSLPPRSVTTRR